MSTPRLSKVPATRTPTTDKPYDPEPAREQTRGWLAGGILAIFFIEILLFFGLAYFHEMAMADIKELAIIMFTPSIGILGTVLGFYFGSQRSK